MINREAIERCKNEYKKVTDEMCKLAGQIDTLDPVADANEIRKHSRVFDILDAKADGMLLIMNAFGYTMYQVGDDLVAHKINN